MDLFSALASIAPHQTDARAFQQLVEGMHRVPPRKQEYEDAAAKLGAVCKWGEEIKPGDLYLACRNTGMQLLTCRSNNKVDGWIVPTTLAYSFDTHECVKVV